GPPRFYAVHRAADDVSALNLVVPEAKARSASSRRCPRHDESCDACQREPLDTPAPTLTAPPIFTQVLVPSILTKPAPYSAQALAEFERFSGSSLPDVAALPGFWERGCSAAAATEESTTVIITRRDFRIPPFIAARRSVPDWSLSVLIE